jgi:hypothetical protein
MPSSDIPEIITGRLASGRRLPRLIVRLSKGWTSFGVSQIQPDMGAPGPRASPTEFGYGTIVWLGRAMVVVRRKYHTRPQGGSLPRHVLWEFRGHAWGEAIYSVLHGQPIRSFIIPERANKLLNFWGPN